MGQEADQALRAIEQTRAKLERDIDDLFSRVPEPAVLAARARTYGAAAAGAVVVTGVAVVSARSRAQARGDRMRARVNAEELARAFSPHPAAPDASSHAGLWALIVAVVAIVAAVAGRAGR